MGHLTKSKGRVTEADIHIASQLMDRMNLHGASRTAAQNAFRVGKSDNYPLREKMRQFRSVCLLSILFDLYWILCLFAHLCWVEGNIALRESIAFLTYALQPLECEQSNPSGRNVFKTPILTKSQFFEKNYNS